MFGRPFRLPCFANAVLAISLAIAVLAAPSSTNAAATSLDDFGALPPADQRALLEKTIRRRIELTQNVRFEIETAMFNAEVDELHYEFDPRLRDEEKKGYQRRYSQARIGASYLSKTTEISRDGRPVKSCVVNLFDARSGVNRGYVTHSEGQHAASGRIGRYQDIVDTHNTYNFWYPGENRYFGNSLLAGLLSGLDDAEITVDRERGLVILRTRQSDASTGEFAETTVDIAPARTFLPVRFRRYITEKASGEYRFFVAFDVLQTRESKGLDLPVRIRKVISNGVERPGHQTAINDIVVKNIEIGSVERSDLVLQFPANTRVIDEIEGGALHGWSQQIDFRGSSAARG
ncbi:hypothetical protein [Candidatus Laterigemmans baculatus]|uniref:hypothetical protein n=1 Tax=Candidatus Laterigemmans baculatus TaxID=2770505 RepID=UPI0013DC27DC|nr:hypothetical protein [Candidatus Laterigemmans baculatus]